MARQRSGIDRVRYRVDWVRGLGALVLFCGIAVAAILAGGMRGWLLGPVILLLCVLTVAVWFVRRDRY